MQCMYQKLMYDAIYFSIYFIVREQAHKISRFLMPCAALCTF